MTEVEGESQAEPVTVETTEQDSAPESTPELTLEQRLEAAEKAKAALEKRIARQTAANREQQRQREEIQRERDELKSKFSPKDSSGEPKPDDYTTTEDYLEAKGAWKAEQRFKQEAEAKQKAEEKQRMDAYARDTEKRITEKQAEMREMYPDYDEVAEVVNEALSYAPDGLGKSAFAQYILEAENGPALYYAIGKDVEFIERVGKLSPIGVIKELVKLEMGLTKTEPKAKVEPRPLTPLKSNGRASKSLEQKTGKELLDWVYS